MLNISLEVRGQFAGLKHRKVDIERRQQPKIDNKIGDDIKTVLIVKLLIEILVKNAAADADDGRHRI